MSMNALRAGFTGMLFATGITAPLERERFDGITEFVEATREPVILPHVDPTGLTRSVASPPLWSIPAVASPDLGLPNAFDPGVEGQSGSSPKTFLGSSEYVMMAEIVPTALLIGGTVAYILVSTLIIIDSIKSSDARHKSELAARLVQVENERKLGCAQHIYDQLNSVYDRLIVDSSDPKSAHANVDEALIASAVANCNQVLRLVHSYNGGELPPKWQSIEYELPKKRQRFLDHNQISQVLRIAGDYKRWKTDLVPHRAFIQETADFLETLDNQFWGLPIMKLRLAVGILLDQIAEESGKYYTVM